MFKVLAFAILLAVTGCQEQQEVLKWNGPTQILQTETIVLDCPVFVLDADGDIGRIEYPQGTPVTESPFYWNEERYIMVTKGEGQISWWKH